MTTMSLQERSTGFRITGRKVFLALVAFFGIITVANVVMIWLAVGSFPGVVTESAYKSGREYASVLEAAETQRALGWRLDEQVVSSGPAGGVAIRIDANDRTGAPLSGLSVFATLASPTHDGLDRRATLREGEVGLYTGTAEGLPTGQYDLAIEATSGSGEVFRSVNRIVLSETGGAQ